MTVRDVYFYIDSLAPFSTQDKFDNSGLLSGDFDAEVTKIAVCLDITHEVIDEAAALGANLIISHHPVIFHPLKSVYAGSVVYSLIEKKMNAICVHTNIDMAKGGITDIMLELLDYKSDEVLQIIHPELGLGYGKIVTLDFASDAKSLAELCKKAFGCTVVRYCDNNRPCMRIAICSGAGGSDSDVIHAAELGCDALITGDVKWSAFVEGKNRSVAVIDAGHFHTENVLCNMLVSKLTQEFEADVFVPSSNEDLCRYL